MNIALITGSGGLVGSQAALFFAEQNFKIVGIDNDMRSYFFGREASTEWMQKYLRERLPGYDYHNVDIRDYAGLEKIFKQFNKDIRLVIHTAAQPSHDWAAKEPLTDFEINANGTLNLLELTRQYSSSAVFIFTSTNKVYGDRPNALPLVELETRFEIQESHPFFNGIDESMSVDDSKHSLFGASKLAADILVQEYGRYFGMKTVCFRAGCLTGPNHSGAELHGFLAYLVKCCISQTPYTIYGYKGKQVRDNIHSFDLVSAFDQFYRNPRRGEVYNIGGGRGNSCSLLEAVALCQKETGKILKTIYNDQNRPADHIWYVTNFKKFQTHYPAWRQTYSLEKTIKDIHAGVKLQ